MPKHDLEICQARLDANLFFRKRKKLHAVVKGTRFADVRLAIAPVLLCPKAACFHLDNKNSAVDIHRDEIWSVRGFDPVVAPPVSQHKGLNGIFSDAVIRTENRLKVAFQKTLERRASESLM